MLNFFWVMMFFLPQLYVSGQDCGGKMVTSSAAWFFSWYGFSFISRSMSLLFSWMISVHAIQRFHWSFLPGSQLQWVTSLEMVLHFPFSLFCSLMMSIWWVNVFSNIGFRKITICLLNYDYFYTVNATGETLLLIKYFPTKNKVFLQQKAGQLGKIGILPA